MIPETCPECECHVNIPEGTLKNEIVRCPGCGVDLEVVRVNPYLLEVAPPEEEDWGE